MRPSPIFQPSLNSSCTVPQSKAYHDGITFAAHYPADGYAASLANGEARLELWTDLPVSQCSPASTSRATAWKAVPLLPLTASIDRNNGYVFAVTVKCFNQAAEAVFSFTYRIVHPDGKIDWISSPSNDGQIFMPSRQGPCYTLRQLVQPHSTTELNLGQGEASPAEVNDSFTLACLTTSRRHTSGSIGFSIMSSRVQSGLVIERTKSTWCTSRRFQSLTEVSPDFGSNLIVLELSQSCSNEVLVVLPVFDDGQPPARLVRGPCGDDVVNFEITGGGASHAKVSLALGTAAKLKEVITACRIHAARSLRTSIHEPLGLSWSARKTLDVDSPLSDVVVPSVPCAYDESDCVDVSFCSDSTAVDSADQSPSSANSLMIPSSGDETPPTLLERDDASTVSGDDTVQAEALPSPPQSKAGLGFCTWEAMQNQERRPYLSEVVAALEAAESRLGQGSIVALLINDGWQDVVCGADDRGRLNSFDMDPAILDIEDAASLDKANVANRPSVLARYTAYIQKRFPAIRSVGCWMTLAGYWDGIHPDGPIAAGLSAPLRHVRLEDPFRQASRNWFVQATELDMHLFWDRAFHSLRESGVDFVKIDAQAEWEWIQEDASSGQPFNAAALGKAAFEAMEGAAMRYFGTGGGVIHSMAFTSNLTNTLRTLSSQGMTVRCTDDFFPQIPEAHRHHLAHNVYNSLLLPHHRCDADMLSHCLGSSSVAGQDYTGFHASFRAFTDARLWVSDKANAPVHDSLRALVAPPTLSNAGASVCVQASGSLMTGSAFDDFVSDGVGPALKMTVQHESTASATVGLWNLRGSAETFDVLQPKQMLSRQDEVEQVASSLHTYYAVRSFRSGQIWLLASGADQEGRESGSLGATLPAGSWEVLTVSPLRKTMVQGVSVALLGATEYFMTPGAVQAVTIATAYPHKESRRRSDFSHFRRPSHQRHRSNCSSSNISISSRSRSPTTMAIQAKQTESALTTVAVESLMQRSDAGARAVLLSLALVNGFFAILQTMITGAMRVPGKGNGSVAKAKTPGADIADTMIGMLDKLQTLFVFGLLVLASWTCTLPRASAPSGPKPSWRRFLNAKQTLWGDASDAAYFDDATLRKVRLRPADAVSTLKRCLTARTMLPLRSCPISLADPQPSSPSTPQSPRPDVVVTALVDIAAKISFLVLCPTRDAIKTCKIDRTRYDTAATPWIRVEPVQLEAGSAQDVGKTAFCVEINLQAYKASQDESVVQTLSAPVSVSLRISGGAE
ncbi:hypothetical protein EX895_000602 [Sporisorium graminicola]|uniref:Alpha-galactosidase n=1 Tax=Sporisorium graminicola TaxID=280036 RepID=A0A4U7L087_9BASI|nr:hypothetical protein EX895_000602 [Sporisorium graminicola]TKY90604.1 hypothetical protein EX895_000602 [Sporisorium graminicola]